MSNSPAILPAADRDALLARLLGELTDQLRQGRKPDLDALIRQHPDLAQDLRELWAAAQFAEEFAKPALQGHPTVDLAKPALEAQPGPLPRDFGDYELLEVIGRGGMGVVYKARQKTLGRTVALKMIRGGPLASDADRKRFRGEAESAGRLEHPGIVPVHEVGEIDGQAYFSMKYVEGETLAARVAAGPLPARAAAEFVSAIARAVHHAHQHGILHRDLKPSNVLLDADGRPHVSDFGLAKRVDSASLTQSGAILGTPSYMAPEQAAGSRGTVSAVSDVYSLGTILYELLTGRPPFQAPSAVDTIMLVLEQEPVPPRRLNPKVDRDLEMICLKCLQKPPALRYASAELLADDLDAFLKGEPISARPSNLFFFVLQMLRETHQAAVLENWGLLWMWHSLVLLVLCTATNVLYWYQVSNVYPYLALWVVGLGTWASIFWAMRRRGGPLTFVERQIAHVWAASTSGSISLFIIEILLGLPVLKLSPVLGILAGMVFLIKAGMLSGAFYISAAASFLAAILMALFPAVGPLLFGVVSAACFFIPGLKYYRQRARAESANQ